MRWRCEHNTTTTLASLPQGSVFSQRPLTERKQMYCHLSAQQSTFTLLTYVWFKEFPKEKWEETPSFRSPFFEESATSLGQRVSVLPTIKTSLESFLVDEASGLNRTDFPESSLYHSAVGLDCWGTSHDALGLFFAPQTPPWIYAIIIVVNFFVIFPLTNLSVFEPLSCPLKPPIAEADGRPS